MPVPEIIITRFDARFLTIASSAGTLRPRRRGGAVPGPGGRGGSGARANSGAGRARRADGRAGAPAGGGAGPGGGVLRGRGAPARAAARGRTAITPRRAAQLQPARPRPGAETATGKSLHLLGNPDDVEEGFDSVVSSLDGRSVVVRLTHRHHPSRWLANILVLFIAFGRLSVGRLYHGGRLTSGRWRARLSTAPHRRCRSVEDGRRPPVHFHWLRIHLYLFFSFCYLYPHPHRY